MITSILILLVVSVTLLMVVVTTMCVMAGTKLDPEARQKEDEIQAEVLAAYHKR